MTPSVALLAAGDPSAGEQATFWICATLAVVGALGLVLSRKTVHSALFTALTMLNLAVLYVANQAPFLGLVQVIVYTGAVMMLFLFVLMLVGVDASDSFVETLKGQRVAALLLVLGFGILLFLAIGTALSGVEAVGLDAANDAQGGNVQGLAQLMFTTFLLPLEVVAALLITAALGALVLAHRERWAPKMGQPEMSRARMERYLETGEHPGPLPSPGVLATSNAIGTPALLPDGSASELSIPAPLRGESRTRLSHTQTEIDADVEEVRGIAAGEETVRPTVLDQVDGHTDLTEVYPDDEKGGVMDPSYYVILSAILFCIGAVGVLVRRNAIVVFMSVEMMLNASNLAFVAFARMHGNLEGQVIAFFVMVVAAAEVVVGLAIIMTIFRTRRSVSIDEPSLMRN